jgi:ABC-type Fe3+ transport system substrate-binding protein
MSEVNMNGRSSRFLACGLLRASLAAACCSAPARAQSLDQLYALAKPEKSLILSAAGPAGSYATAARAFEQKFPGIEVALTDGFSSVLGAKVEQQVQTGRLETDVVILHTIQDFVRWAARKALVPFKPDGFDNINRSFRDSTGGWIAVSTHPIFYGYNSEHVPQTEVPKLAIDFLRPQLKGKLISAYPADDDASLFAFTTIVRKYGWGYMAQYMKQAPKFVQGHLPVARSLGSGESLLSFDTTTGSAVVARDAGGKIGLVGPVDDYLPVVFFAEAILKDAPHPNTAKLFVAWLLSKESQSRSGTYSPRSDVPPPAGLPMLSNYRIEDRYLEFVTGGEDTLSDLRRRFESYTGPVVNAGAVR